MSDSFCGHILHATETRQLNSYNSAFIIMLIIQYDSPSHNHNILHCCLCCSCCALKRSSLQYYNEALYCSATQPIHLMQDKYTYYIYVYIYIYIYIYIYKNIATNSFRKKGCKWLHKQTCEDTTLCWTHSFHYNTLKHGIFFYSRVLHYNKICEAYMTDLFSTCCTFLLNVIQAIQTHHGYNFFKASQQGLGYRGYVS